MSGNGIAATTATPAATPIIYTLDETQLQTLIAGAVLQAQLQLPPSTAGGRIYGALPDVFKGNRAKYGDFRHKLVSYVAQIPKDTQKIRATLSLLADGEAAVWARAYCKRNEGALSAGTVLWSSFLADLDKTFVDPRAAEKARADLFTMRIKHGETVEDFFVRFALERDEAGMTEPANETIIIDYLAKTLPSALVSHVLSDWEGGKQKSIHDADIELSVNIIDAVQHAAKVDAINKQVLNFDSFRKLAEILGPTIKRFNPGQFGDWRGRMSQGHQSHSSTRASPTWSDPDPMQVDRLDRKKSGSNTGKCYNCDEPGHIARRCPKPKKQRQDNQGGFKRPPVVRMLCEGCGHSETHEDERAQDQGFPGSSQSGFVTDQ